MTRIVIPALLLSLALAACTPEPDEQTEAAEQSQAAAAEVAQPAGEEPLAPPPAEGSCDDTQAQWAVGKSLTEAELEQARNDAKAQTVRVLKPGQAVTMEFDGNRLNVDQDEQGVVTAVRCG
ncbi:I78 family peptidase inhibitor [Pseudoxanthomonas wuyuanensis]